MKVAICALSFAFIVAPLSARAQQNEFSWPPYLPQNANTLIGDPPKEYAALTSKFWVGNTYDGFAIFVDEGTAKKADYGLTTVTAIAISKVIRKTPQGESYSWLNFTLSVSCSLRTAAFVSGEYFTGSDNKASRFGCLSLRSPCQVLRRKHLNIECGLTSANPLRSITD